jgi:hypothetical protein
MDTKYLLGISMANYFFTDILHNEINFTIPVFNHQAGYSMAINIVKVNNNEFRFYLRFLNDKKQTIGLSGLEKDYISFFFDAYQHFILNLKFDRTKNFLSKLKADLVSAKKMIANRQLSIVAFLSELPRFPEFKIYTFDQFDRSCIARTIISGGKIHNIFNSYYSNTQSWYFGTLNLNLLLRSFTIGMEYDLKIIERLLSYIRPVVYFGIVILNLYVFYLITGSDPTKFQLHYLFLCAISIIGIPLSRWLLKEGFYFFIRRNISALFKTAEHAAKKKEANHASAYR